MYSGILNGKGSRGASSKEKLQQKQGNAISSSPSDPSLPIDEFLDLKCVLSALKQSLLRFNKTIADSTCEYVCKYMFHLQS